IVLSLGFARTRRQSCECCRRRDRWISVMSSIYIQEPPSNGKVLLETTVGDIDIELWSKETPKACRNFVQLCVEGYYDGTLFHRIVKGFIAQGGDPTGTGTGGESIYGKPFKDEIHQRLRFVRRGLVAMANGGRDDNASQFFFTFQDAPELQGKHTIFGKVVGDTIYNMMKLEDTIVDKEDRPLYPQKLIRAKILSNPFDDIQPRVVKQEKPEKVESKSKSKGTKNFSLLSFGQEAEEDEEEVDSVTSIMKIKSKSSHDLTDDPSLSSVPAVDVVKRDHDEDVEALQEKLESIRKKLKRDDTDQKVTDESKVNADDNDDIED
ncbi:CWC27 (predicted), partial [Pycnogonum litorale]